jgi:hypothetical protein
MTELSGLPVRLTDKVSGIPVRIVASDVPLGGGGEGGAVDSVDGRTGAVTLGDLYQPLDSDLTAISALTTTTFGRALLVLANAAALRGAAELGSAALLDGDALQPFSATLAALAELNPTEFGTEVLELADAAALAALIPSVLPAGGSTGQVLVKDSGTDYDASWGAVPVAESVEVFDPSGAAVALSAATIATMHLVVLSANCTVTVPTPVAGHAHYVRVAQDGTGGRTLTWAGSLNWPDDVVPGQASAADEYSVYVLTCDDATFGWVGRQGGAGSGGGGGGAASDVTFSPTGAISATNVQAAIAELDTEKASAASLTAHLDDTTAAHAASAISFDPTGNSWANGTTTQLAIDDLDGAVVAIFASLGSKANLASPALTGNPTAPTQAAGTNNTRLATTAYADAGLVINAQSGTTYTLVLTDQNKVVECTNASPITLTVPTSASVPFPVGTVLTVYQGGAGQVTLAAAGGVTLRNDLKTPGQYKEIGLRKRATDEWIVTGGVA